MLTWEAAINECQCGGPYWPILNICHVDSTFYFQLRLAFDFSLFIDRAVYITLCLRKKEENKCVLANDQYM